MGRAGSLALGLLAVTVLVASVSAKLEQPEYTVLHFANEYEVRTYTDTVWAVSKQSDISFARATTQGFHKLFQYIEGANMNSTRIEMTAPVWTGIVPSAGPFCSSAFEVRLYLPEKLQSAPPTPLPELGIEIQRFEKQTIAVREFSGYASDNNVAQEAEKLSIALSSSDFTKGATYPVSGSDSYGIAQYNSPFQIFNRRNEVWVGIDFFSNSTSSEESHIRLP